MGAVFVVRGRLKQYKRQSSRDDRRLRNFDSFVKINE
jgi:hypothetical protein